jgi:hypothetical protein
MQLKTKETESKPSLIDVRKGQNFQRGFPGARGGTDQSIDGKQDLIR